MSGPIRAIDLFCGGGGFSTGLKRAVDRLGRRVDLLAINHWTEAVNTHSLNHPDVRHLQEDLAMVDPRVAHPDPTVDILLAAPECFPAGTLILCERGLIPIEDVQLGDRVLTHEGRWRAVVRLMRSIQPTVVLSGHGHNTLELTANHRLFSLKPGPYRHSPAFKGNRRELPEPEWTPAETIVGRYWSTPTVMEPLPIPEVPTGLSWWIIGRWLADGIAGGKNPHQVALAVGKAKADDVAQHLDPSWRRYERRTTTLFSCRQRGYAPWLIRHFGRLSHGKTLPSWALTLPEEARRELLDGYLAGDGCTGRRAKNASFTKATTVSKRLGVGLRLLAESLGHRTALSFRHRRTHAVIEGRRVPERPQWNLGWGGGEREFGLATKIHSWLRVKRVRPGREAVEVYNLEVEEDHSYIADGIVAINCTSHSYSRGDRPISEQSRSTADHVFRWIDQRNVKRFIIENVPAFRAWGPTDRKGRPIKERRGEVYAQYIDRLRSFNYNVETRVLNTADHGGATTRKRLFIYGEKGTRRPRWPQPTHAPAGQLLPGLRPWRGAKEIIDPSIEGRSIFRRMFEGDPLAFNTMQRILTGGDRFWPQLRPWLTILRQHMAGQSIELPVPTIVGGGTHMGVAEPVLLKVSHTGANGLYVRPASEPLYTLTTANQEQGIAEPVVVTVAHGSGNGRGNAGRTRSASDPLPATTGSRDYGVASMLVNVAHADPSGRVRSAEDPAPTLTGSRELGVAEAFVIGQQSNAAPRASGDPLPTIATAGKIAHVEPIITKYHGGHRGKDDGARRSKSSSDPLATVDGSNRFGLAEPIVVAAGGAWDVRPQSVEDPLRTVMPTASKGVAEAIIVGAGGPSGQGRAMSADEPLRTILGENHQAIAEPVVIVQRTNNAPHSIDEPVPCLNTGGHIGLASAFLLQQQSGGVARPVDEPAPTVATKGAISLVEPVVTGETSEEEAGQPFLIPFNGEAKGQAPRSHSVEAPLPTVTTGGAGQKGLAQPYLVGYYGNGHVYSADHPVCTLTGKDRYGLVTADFTPEDVAGFVDLPIGTITPWGIKIGRNLYLDIRFRMLKVHELAAAMGFPQGYRFLGTQDEQVKQVGNAVSVEMAEALCFAALGGVLVPA